MSDEVKPELHFRSKGKGWKAACAMVGLDIDSPICGQRGKLATVVGDIGCSQCSELRSMSVEEPLTVAIAVKTIHDSGGALVMGPDLLEQAAEAARIMSGASGDGENEISTEPEQAITPEQAVGVHQMIGDSIIQAVDLGVRVSSRKTRAVAPPSSAVRLQIGAYALTGISTIPFLAKFFTGPYFALVAAAQLIIANINVVGIAEPSPDEESVKLTPAQIEQLWNR